MSSPGMNTHRRCRPIGPRNRQERDWDEDLSPVGGKGLKGAFSDPLIVGILLRGRSGATTTMQRGFTITFKQVLPVPVAWDTAVKPPEGKDIIYCPSCCLHRTGRDHRAPRSPKKSYKLPQNHWQICWDDRQRLNLTPAQRDGFIKQITPGHGARSPSIAHRPVPPPSSSRAGAVFQPFLAFH